MVGSGSDTGKCTIEVDVDGAAEVAVSGDSGRLRTFSGQTAVWRRFECNGQLPRNPSDFRFRGRDGRGQVDLVSDPRDRGVAVVRIEDPKGGREGYTFDLEWTGMLYSNNRDLRRDDSSVRTNVGIVMMVSLEGVARDREQELQRCELAVKQLLNALAAMGTFESIFSPPMPMKIEAAGTLSWAEPPLGDVPQMWISRSHITGLQRRARPLCRGEPALIYPPSRWTFPAATRRHIGNSD